MKRRVRTGERLAIRAVSICVALLVISLALSGWYETDHPLLKVGDYADVAGPYHCQSSLDGRHVSFKLTGRRSGFFSSSHAYETDSSPPEKILFKKLGDKFYLGQIAEKGAFKYVYVALGNDNQFSILGPNLLNPAPLDQLSKQNNVQFRVMGGGDRFILVGTDDNELAFLTRHQQWMLTGLLNCQRSR
jgi:hypothetical protein